MRAKTCPTKTRISDIAIFVGFNKPHTHTQMSKFGVGELHLFCLLWSRHYKLWNITI